MTHAGLFGIESIPVKLTTGFIRTGLLSLAVLVTAPPAAAAQTMAPAEAEPVTPSGQAARLPAGARIKLDGLLDEPVWRTVPPITGLRQREPGQGVPATERTEVSVLYDDGTLYIGVNAYDSEPDKIIARILQRDRVMRGGFGGRPQFGGDDAIAILFDPFHDHRNALIFATNPNGAQFDALLTDEGREFNIDWRAVWRVAAKKTARGWSAEFAIPFRTLRYPNNNTDEPWGFNVFRMIRRKNEQVLWTAWTRDGGGFQRVSLAGHLHELKDLPRPGLNLELKPFTLSGATQKRQDAGNIQTDSRFDAGLDLKYEVKPGLLLDLTANTDFAQVEVDDQQVNLTRFSLFFPEKRDFFLENAGIFNFGVSQGFGPPPILLFFSRRIGISSDGEIPVIGGARLTGRAGAQTVGFLNVVTDEKFDQPRTNFSVARVKRDVGGSGYIGAIVTDRRNSAENNTVAGVDWSLWPTAILNFQGFAARSRTSGQGGEDNAYRLGLDYTADHIGFFASHLFIGPEMTAATGFITRSDVRINNGFFRVTARPELIGLRQIRISASGNYVTHADWELQDWEAGPRLTFEWNSGERLNFNYQKNFTRLDEGFSLADGVDVAAGDYDGWKVEGSFNTSTNRTVSIRSQASFERFFDGDLFSTSGAVQLTPGSHLSVNMSIRHNDVDIPAGSFTADIYAMRLGYAFTPRLTANALIQYNSLDNLISTNVRLNFIHRPGSDIFLVFNETRGDNISTSRLQDRGVIMKVTYLGRI